MKVKRIISFVLRYVFTHPIYAVMYGVCLLRKNFVFNIHLYTPEEIALMIKNGKSVIRLGDGEISTIPLGLPNCYQEPNKVIKKMLRTIVRDYTAHCPYVLSVPRFINMKNSELKSIGKLYVWLPIKVMFLLRFNKKTSYMDAHNFYYDNYFDTIVAPIIKNKKIICVTNKKTIEKQKKNINLPWREIFYVECPEYDALDSYDTITTSIDTFATQYDKRDIVILVAVGPVGKYLAYEYAHKGYQSLDIGKVAEVMFTGESIQYLI